MFEVFEKDKEIKILVVEDEAIIAYELTKKLSQLGFNPLKYVDTGERAILSIEENSPDLVILDIKIKGAMDGIEIAEIIKENYEIPFIFLSAFSDSRSLERVRSTEPYGYIPKNSTKIDLYTTVKIALQRFMIEKEFQSKDKMLSATLRSISDAVIGLNREGFITAWNKGAENIFGWKIEEIIGENISILVPSYIPNEIPGIMDDLAEQGTFRLYDALCQRKDKSVLNVSITISPVDSKNGRINGFSFVIKDISEKKELEKQIIDILEEERFRIGRDLHDNLGQYLTGILLKLKVLETSLKEKELEEEKDLTGRISNHVKMVLERMRELSRGLIAMGLQKMSLKEAIQELTLFYSRVHGIDIRCSSEIDFEINNYRVVTQLYHIAQEAITNAVKHSGCSRIDVTLKIDETDIILSVKDNGKGFDKKSDPGLGLKIMKYRAGIINGHMQIFSSSTGTILICSVPKVLIRDNI